MPAKKASGRKVGGSARAPERRRVALTIHSLRGTTEDPPSGYRAVCARGDYQGPKRPTRRPAILDALTHQEAHPSHKVEVLGEQ